MVRSLAIKAEMLGADEVGRWMRQLESKVFRPAARKGVQDATKIVVRYVKSRVPVRTGAAKKAVGAKVVALKNLQGYVGIVGPRRDLSEAKFQAAVEAYRGGKRKTEPKRKFRRTVKYQGREILVNPAKTFHFIEFGRGVVRPVKRKVLSDGRAIYGTRVAAVAGVHPVEQGWNASRSAAVSAMREAMRSAIRRAGGSA